MQYRAYWETPHDYATSRTSQNFGKRDANTLDEAKSLVEEHHAGYIEVLDEGTVVQKLYLDDGEDWRREQPTDNQTHQKIDLGEYE